MWIIEWRCLNRAHLRNLPTRITHAGIWAVNRRGCLRGTRSLSLAFLVYLRCERIHHCIMLRRGIFHAPATLLLRGLAKKWVIIRGPSPPRSLFTNSSKCRLSTGRPHQICPLRHTCCALIGNVELQVLVHNAPVLPLRWRLPAKRFRLLLRSCLLTRLRRHTIRCSEPLAPSG